MIEKKVFVSESFDPIHVALLVQHASQFASHISIILNEKTANAKSMLGIISLELQGDKEIIIMADGDDAETAVFELSKFFECTAA